jgi:hypothetical protein
MLTGRWLMAAGPHRTVYADDIPGGVAFEAHQQLVSVSGTKVTLLWQESDRTPK